MPERPTAALLHRRRTGNLNLAGLYRRHAPLARGRLMLSLLVAIPPPQPSPQGGGCWAVCCWAGPSPQSPSGILPLAGRAGEGGVWPSPTQRPPTPTL